MQLLRLMIRLPLFLLYLMLGFIMILVCRILKGKAWYNTLGGQKTVMYWMKGVAYILGVKAEVSGEFADQPSLIISNHISWLDIVVISAHGPCTFLSKSDVKSWPVIGWLASLSGTLFVRRDSKRGLHEIKQKIQSSLKNGRSVVVFPEGTTTNGLTVKPFKSALYQSVSELGGNIQAIALRYETVSGPYSHAAFIDDDEFVTHLLTVLKMPQTQVKITLFTPHQIQKNSDRKALAELTYRQICSVGQFNSDTANVVDKEISWN